MPYVAHVGIVLSDSFTAYEKDRWVLIQQSGDLRFYRRINRSNLYEIACELFSDKEKALMMAKRMYTQALFNLLERDIHIADGGCQMYQKRIRIPELDGDEYPDWFFFWTPKNQGGGVGPDVYEVYNTFDDFDEIYKHIPLNLEWSISISDLSLEFSNYDHAPFLYDEVSQYFLNKVVKADSAFDHGLKMTIYCGVLEQIADCAYKDNPGFYKDKDVLCVIDRLIEQVNQSELSKEKINSLVTLLKSGKKTSARQNCKNVAKLYAKLKYGDYDTEDIISDAYNTRSSFSHGANRNKPYAGPASFMKFVVLDVIAGYFRDSSINHRNRIE